MPGLPHGWRMRNKDGEVAGPPPEADGVYDSQDEDSEDGFAEALDVRPDSEGWEDAEDDTEVLSIKCLLCDEKFPTAQAMSEHCAKTHDFDLVSVQRQHKLDFYTTIKFVNYIRSEVKAGKERPDVSDAASWSDDKFLQPALDEDALLFSLDDILDAPVEAEDDTQAGSSK
ncbi:Ribosomal protein arginine N-methyltransferase rmt3 [Fulvia fulva]|uniref:type I protein arginine methyltransferase n=1 Tax=Passalora fulva TaxID=5499 RepID=A0A9Q8LF71_PASFU|nr:Ribosomal protein arginine N-methyltransferase rmt3 [Fulvia fulva]KAK4627282.1 Ribosomal protein arginine N-methyltransferase rmt3 [Fulvia fulva]KAK4628688.1 Ribosomal protein arginine N-methyltransferase rmt3 [Fulvia fulva]UJO16327.1 Ribosomal protein arginine N-methyltransferase rmt3 [Fulvia fulva]WPV13227.1 Ribosomal protein arginine N-methyltransferase rmt3 [Fulvia fulva]WPV28311.1 Ribosomal protein arginine N-methyltransferase rmt3 [Fulvia fulva]